MIAGLKWPDEKHGCHTPIFSEHCVSGGKYVHMLGCGVHLWVQVVRALDIEVWQHIIKLQHCKRFFTAELDYLLQNDCYPLHQKDAHDAGLVLSKVSSVPCVHVATPWRLRSLQ
jgi:hypothetical protein